MSVPLTPPPPVSPAEMQVLVARAGLILNPGQMADLVLAWRQVAGLLALIPRDRPLADDQAFVFRLPPPPASDVTASRTPAPPRARPRHAAAPAPGKQPAGKKPAGKKSAGRKPAARKVAGKPARRGR